MQRPFALRLNIASFLNPTQHKDGGRRGDLQSSFASGLNATPLNPTQHKDGGRGDDLQSPFALDAGDEMCNHLNHQDALCLLY